MISVPRLRAVCAAFLLAGCSGGPLPALTAGPDPADPRAAGAQPAYLPVTAGTAHHQPVEPLIWRDMNERVAPRAGRSP